MKQVYIFLFLIVFVVFRASATHIVGGEFELKASGGTGYTYTLTLNLYFDEVNGNPGAEDPTVSAAIFSKRTNSFITAYTLPQVGQQQVNYTNPACTDARLRTRLIQYSLLITLSPGIFNDPEGYYVVWERCCRNQIITNINFPGDAGNSFYMEFPAVVQNGGRFINSSPSFVIPNGDYACVNTPFIFDFGATDSDGDQLIYSLVTPISGYSSKASPNPSAQLFPNYNPGPYPSVRWAPGIDLNNVIPGPAPLRVNPTTGQLSFTANKIGLYVFSVRCEEYRNGRKIGEVRRDFQLMVIDCPINEAPVVRLKESGKNDFYVEGQLINITDPAQRCLDLLITDKNRQNNVNFTVRPLNFDANLATITPSSGVIQATGDTLRARLCISECIDTPGPYWFEVVATDNGCPAPQRDTLLVQFNVPLAPNNTPDIVTNLLNNTGTVDDGGVLSFAVTGTDPDQELITLRAVGQGFNLADLGMSFLEASGNSMLTVPFTWQPNCNRVQPGVVYSVDFIVMDRRCPGKEKRDTVTVQLTFREKFNQQPEISTDLLGDTASLKPGNQIRFNVLGIDRENDPVTIRAVGRGFDLAAAGMQFQNGQGGIGQVTGPFYWQPTCQVLAEMGGYFAIDFIVEDNRCAANRADTVLVEFNLSDYEVVGTFLPPNVFTPNGDDSNPTFYIPNLPPDNCRDQFQRIEVYNRWGKLVFESTSREFAWTGDGYPTGIYYYQIKYRNSLYKGTVSLLR